MFLAKFWGKWSSYRSNRAENNKLQRRGRALERACFEALEDRQLMSMSIVDFELVDADTDAAIMTLKDGTVLDVSKLPTRNLTIKANKDGTDIDSVRFGLDGNSNYRTDNGYPYALSDSVGSDFDAWALPANGTHTLKATPYDANDGAGTAGTSHTVSFSVVNGTGTATPPTTTTPQAPSSTTSGGSAAFVSSDTTPRGDWKGVYGSEGHHVIGDAARVPSYAKVTPVNAGYYLWADHKVYGNELQRSSQSGYIAGTYYSSTSFNVDVNVTDGREHKVTMYFMDYEGAGRRQKVEVLRASDGAVLDTRTFGTDFHRGVYQSWNVTGNVRFRVTRTAGINAVVSGIFFDPAAGGTSTTTPTTTTPSAPTTTVGGLVAPSQTVINQAIAKPLIRYNRSIAGGAHTDQPSTGEAPMLMAAAAKAGNTTADARILQQIRYTITGGNDITANGGYPSQHERHVTGMIAVVRHVPRIWDQLTPAERAKVDTMMKASLVASAFTTSDTNPYVLARTSERALDGDSNVGRNWNPNYREGMVGGVLVGMAYFGGPDAVNAILNNYDHDEFVGQLKAYGLSNGYQTFNWKSANPSASAPTGTQIENAVYNYRYLGLSINNPMGIYWKLTENTYGKNVAAGLNGGAGINGYGRILSGADALPNKGALGMLKEFDSSDGNGARSSATYAYDGYRVNQTNMYVLIANGYWNKASGEAASSLSRIKVGATDLWYKLSKGYSNYAKGASRGEDSLAENGKHFEFTREVWENVLKEYHNI